MSDQAQTPPPQGLTKTSGLLDRIPGWAWTAAGLAVTAAAARGSLLRRVALGLVGTAITAAGARRATKPGDHRHAPASGRRARR